MFKLFSLKIALTLAGLLSFCALLSQSQYGFTLNKTSDICTKGDVRLDYTGVEPQDSVSILWSSGQRNITHVSDLNGGNYSVNIRVIHIKDTLKLMKDTTLYFSIDKEFCGVYVDKYFSPNDDNYHDKMFISNVEFYPNFELNVFNKWGQQVHHQKNNYEPWNGKWNSIDLPDGTYYFIFFYDSANKNKLLKGDVTILR